MTKFILIDNSIENTAGHHYQYAAHCLLAAKDRNFVPVLAANRVFKPPGDDPWQTLSIYHHGFWGAKRKRQKKILDLDRSVSTKINFLKHNALFSRIGLALHNRNVLFNQINLPGVGESMYTSHPRSWVIVSSLIVPFYLLSARMSRSVYGIKRRAYSVATGLSRTDPITGVGIDKDTSHIFARDTERLFKKLKLKENDIIFMPTVGINELLGLGESIQNTPETKFTSINLLFRRNIYSGREHDYWKQDEELRLLRNIFTNFVQRLEDYRLFFYTDSDELTVQYNRLGSCSFHTLPLPHTVSPRVDLREAGSELCVTYIGDARTEKGYHHLPHLIQDVWNETRDARKIKFVIQSNYNIPEGEPKIVVARSQLESLQNSGIISIRLIYDPLSLEDYTKLLLSSDIVLLPYDQLQYHARSSGILVECLAAGIPVIVPSGTWMSRQFMRATYEHCEQLRGTLVVEKSLTGQEITWKKQESKVDPYENGELVFGGETARAYCRLARPAKSCFLFLRFKINASYLSAIKVDLAQLRYDETLVKFSSKIVEKLNVENYYSLLLELNDSCNLVWLGFKNAFNNFAVSLTDIEIAFLSERNIGTTSPSGAVGLAYEYPEQIPELLSQMIRQYSHYRKTALDFSRDYLKIHNAARVIEKVQTVSNRDET